MIVHFSASMLPGHLPNVQRWILVRSRQKPLQQLGRTIMQASSIIVVQHCRRDLTDSPRKLSTETPHLVVVCPCASGKDAFISGDVSSMLSKSTTAGPMALSFCVSRSVGKVIIAYYMRQGRANCIRIYSSWCCRSHSILRLFETMVSTVETPRHDDSWVNADLHRFC